MQTEKIIMKMQGCDPLNYFLKIVILHLQDSTLIKKMKC